MRFFLLFLSLFFLFSSCKEEKVKFIRYEIHSKEAQADVQALNKALDSMKKLDCSNPLSWYYQSAIHWVPDSIIDNSLCHSYHTAKDIKEGWNNCTHTPSGQEKIHFLAWHRLYIWHFERIVRQISGKKDFALPYWGYTDNNPEFKKLQSIFRDSASSLFESARFDSLNKGYSISGETLRSLDLTKLMSYNTFTEFSNHINAAPHGSMHDYIGHGNNEQTDKKMWNKITNSYTSDGLMGWVPTAGFDPIFWTHHSNIDRLWQQWSNSPTGKALTLEMLQSVDWNYVFFDEKGNKVSYTPEKVLEIIYDMDYSFDDTEMDKPIFSERLMSSNQAIQARKLAVQVNTQITDAVTIVIPKVSTGKVKIQLTVSWIDLPSGVYEIYSNSHNLTPSSEEFIGFMTFFGLDHKMPDESCKKGCCLQVKDGRNIQSFEYFVDRRTLLWNEESQLINLVIYKHSGKHDGDLRIDEVVISD